MSSEQTDTSVFSDDVGRMLLSARLHGITFRDVIVVFQKLCEADIGAACQEVDCAVCNPQFLCEPVETAHTVAVSSTTSSPAHAFRHSRNKSSPSVISFLYLFTLAFIFYFRYYFIPSDMLHFSLFFDSFYFSHSL